MFKLPDLIGAPDFQSDPSNFQPTLGASSYKELVENSLQMCYMRPMDTKIDKSINIYKGRHAWDKFVSYLGANEISPGSNSGKLTVVLNNITPLTETYSNEFGQSELFGSVQSIASGGLQEAAFISGYNGMGDLDQMSQQKGIVGTLGTGIKTAIDKVGDLAGQFGIGEEGQADIRSMLANPTQKIDIPSMWKGNSFTAQYEVSVRLQCYNVADEQAYGSRIIASLGALMQFCCPRSETGKFYQWPFLMQFEIPGLVNIPLAYASNMTVVKGGDVSDLSWQWRPNIIDVRMTINTVWGVTVNSADSAADDGGRPTILKQLRTLNNKRGLQSETDASSKSEAAAAAMEASMAAEGRNKDQTADSEAAADALFKAGYT